MTESKPMDALGHFLAENPELEQLSARLAAFNIFHALGIEHVEIRHSNTLAWLLDPAESHGLGGLFLRRLLSNILLQSNAKIADITAAEIELMDFSEVEVRREWQNIDVLVVVNGKAPLVLLIENKINCGEGIKQLVKYHARVRQEFPSSVLVPVFLTLDGHATEDVEATEFVCYSHEQLLELFDRIITSRRSQLTEAVNVFLTHYLDTLRRLTMRDAALVDLCKHIYRKHKDAIDLIVEYGMASEFSRIARESLEGHGNYEILNEGRSAVRFIPKSWADVVPSNGTAWKNFSRPVSVACLIFKATDTKLRLVAEVSSMDDPARRLACVKCLQSHGFKLSKRAFDEKATYSGFFSASELVGDMGNAEQLRVAVEKLLAKAADQFPKADVALREVFQRK